jgi:propionyl-CoA carboxylase beta chain
VHTKGSLTARERIYALLDEGSSSNWTRWPNITAPTSGSARSPLGDGVVTGYGTIDGRDVCIFSQDGEKIVRVQGLAIKTARPLIGINDGAGARIQEGVVSLGLYGEIFYRNILASGVIPQISLIMGAAAAGRHPRSWRSRVGTGIICRGRSHRADGSPTQ